MKIWKTGLPVAVISLLAGQAIAQSVEDQQPRKMEAREAEYSERLREAEERMEMAAREISEITQERLPGMLQVERRIGISDKPRMGIMIDGSDESGPVAGIEVVGVTPESAADDAGLRAGDVITAVNGETMKASNSAAANRRLLDFMQGVEEGDELKVDYLRKGKAGVTELSPRVMQMHAFSWVPGGGEMHFPMAPDMAMHPEAMQAFKFQVGSPLFGSAWGNMELVELNKGLGKYFGTDTGLLVVTAPQLEGLALQDGDVIQSIDGREPKDVRHALRILGSYQGGEKLELGIMRDKKKRTLKIEVPVDLRGSLRAPPAPRPARAPVPSAPPAALPDKVST